MAESYWRINRAELTFMDWMEHEFPDLFRVQELRLDMYDKDGCIMHRRLTRTTWDHAWHQVHRYMKPGNVITIAISHEEGSSA